MPIATVLAALMVMIAPVMLDMDEAQAPKTRSIAPPQALSSPVPKGLSGQGMIELVQYSSRCRSNSTGAICLVSAQTVGSPCDCNGTSGTIIP